MGSNRAPKRNDVFLAHSSLDKEFVHRLARDLKSFGIPVWYDRWNMKVGQSLRRRIEDGISSSGFLAVILSPNSVRSRWVNVELSAAMTKELELDSVFVLPVLYKECSVPIFLRDKLYADFTRSYNAGLEALLESILPARSLKRLVRLPAEGGISSTEELEEKLCLIYRNQVYVTRHYFFPFLSLLTIPDEVFAYFHRTKTGAFLADLKRLRRQLGRERLSARTMSTHDVIAESWLRDYVQNGSYYQTRLPKRLRRIHLKSLMHTLATSSEYQLAIAADEFPQWFLTYRVGTKRLSYISRQFTISQMREPVGLFTQDLHTFDTYDKFFSDTLTAPATLSGTDQVVGRIDDLLSRYC